MAEADATWREALSVYWLLLWRGLVGGAIIGFVGGFIGGAILGVAGAFLHWDSAFSTQLSRLWGISWGSVAMIVWSIYLVRVALRKKFKMFRVAIVRDMQPSA